MSLDVPCKKLISKSQFWWHCILLEAKWLKASFVAFEIHDIEEKYNFLLIWVNNSYFRHLTVKDNQKS